MTASQESPARPAPNRFRNRFTLHERATLEIALQGRVQSLSNLINASDGVPVEGIAGPNHEELAAHFERVHAELAMWRAIAEHLLTEIRGELQP